jgi:hypothetical protein
MATKTARADFEKVFPTLVEDLLGEARKYNLPDNALKWFEKVDAKRKAFSPGLTMKPSHSMQTPRAGN